jgi:hypothetical protein
MKSAYQSNDIRISDPLTALRLWMEHFVADLSDRQISASISDGACKRLVPFVVSTLENVITKSVEYELVSGFLSYDNSIHTCVDRNVTLYFNKNIPSKFTCSCEVACQYGLPCCHLLIMEE